jgi:hypothetical protein
MGMGIMDAQFGSCLGTIWHYPAQFTLPIWQLPMMRNLASHAQQLEIQKVQKVQVKSSQESSNSNEHTSTKSQSEIENLK